MEGVPLVNRRCTKGVPFLSVYKRVRGWTFLCNTPGHSVNDVRLTPLELIRSNRDAVTMAREAHLIHKGKTLSPLGKNRRDEAYMKVTPITMYCCNFIFQSYICNLLSGLSSFFF